MRKTRSSFFSGLSRTRRAKVVARPPFPDLAERQLGDFTAFRIVEKLLASGADPKPSQGSPDLKYRISPFTKGGIPVQTGGREE
jgi:hypothetical protein